MLTIQQIKWAASHDWFQSDIGDGRIIVIDRYSQQHPDGSVTHHVEYKMWDSSFKALRNWAGY